jgi:hypothetical protein
VLFRLVCTLSETIAVGPVSERLPPYTYTLCTTWTERCISYAPNPHLQSKLGNEFGQTLHWAKE